MPDPTQGTDQPPDPERRHAGRRRDDERLARLEDALDKLAGSAAASGAHNGHIRTAEKLGKLVNAYGVPLLMVFFMAIYFGWIKSPISDYMAENNAMLKAITVRMDMLYAQHAAADLERDKQVQRFIELIRIIDCAEIQDLNLRERCFKR